MHWNQLSLCHYLDLLLPTIFLIYHTFPYFFPLYFSALAISFTFTSDFPLVWYAVTSFSHFSFVLVASLCNKATCCLEQYFPISRFLWNTAIGWTQMLSFDLEVKFRTKQENGLRMLIGCTGLLVILFCFPFKRNADFHFLFRDFLSHFYVFRVYFSLADGVFQKACFHICLLVT